MKKEINIIEYTCDVCGEAKEHDEIESVKYPVIFHTDQTEGRRSAPYISSCALDLCRECQGKVLMLDGWGAQGYNRYQIRVNELEG